jgi:DNA-directed RNA polymerase specialized sigma24 family protein
MPGEPGGARAPARAAGRLERFEDLYLREFATVFALAYALSGNCWVAEDIAQDAFVVAHRQWDRIGGYDDPGAWVRRVAANLAVSGVRRRLAEARALVRLAGRQLEPPYAALPAEDGDEEGIDTRGDERMLTDPLPADLPYVVMFDEVCEGLPPPLQNKKDCTRMVRLLELTARDLANVGKGGRYVRVKGAGHDIQDTNPDAVLATVDQVLKTAS